MRKDERGAVLIEALVAFPVLTILSFGLLEFGNLMWQRQQLQVGVRDAARYWSRCRPVSLDFASTCNQVTARNIAFFGNPNGGGNLRVPGWNEASEITFSPAKSGLSSFPEPDDIVKVTGTVTYLGSPAFSALLSNSITITASAEMRSIGW
ncbi:pilus assembly protein [Alisedimentitalea sp. MJ-SS2]|uniref:TadE/TadG family type IV pilus assembly protein n=1 Tax=Aliisedimentitalea sp. MJ-SS2 TaxID=3049795 RepID=UPI0029101A43|nr:pilus assembly protein [Alisedimentitalea sp. MJ-SS2]MDU8928275.1 pilus assembly protein [Alisedimentitalea sp. MJ-SS2]